MISISSEYNLDEYCKETYDTSKLKEFLTIVKYMMQESLYKMAYNSLINFYDFIKERTPDDIKLNSSINVENIFDKFKDLKQEEINDIVMPIPIFHLEVICDKENDCFVYSTNLNDICTEVIDLFEKGLNNFGGLDTIDRRIMPELFKTSPKSKIKVPILPKTKPQIVS
jgi:dynein heavy chain